MKTKLTGEKAKSGDLIYAKTIGIKAIEYAAMQKSTKIEAPSILTFSGKTFKMTKNKSLIQIYQDESVVTRALCFMQQVDDNTRHVAFSHEWSEYPSSLFEVDHRFEIGHGMCKGNKADYLLYLTLDVKDEVQTITGSLPHTVYLIDAMAFCQRNQTLGAKTFGDLFHRYRKFYKQFLMVALVSILLVIGMILK